MPTARCESCKSSFEIEGTTGVCPLCGQAVEVDLTIRVHCSCGTTLKAPPKMRGRVIACPRCTRPVPIPRGDEAEREKGSVQIGQRTRWVFALALLPVFVAIQGENDDPRRRVDRTLTNYKIDASSARTLSGKVALLPGARAERAALPQDSLLPMAFGVAGFVLVMGFVWLSFGTPTLGTRELALAAGVMVLAGLSLGILIKLLFPVPADADSAPRLFLTAALGAAGAELLKSWWILVLRRGKMPRRAVLLLGLAAGAGFGAGFATQAGDAMAGIALARSYWMEFITIISLQAVWGGTAALFICRAAKGASKGALIFAGAGAPLALNAAFFFFHRQEMFLASIIVGLVSFALFHALHFWTEETIEETVAGETIRV